ncbi:MAG: alpha/beta fold hydrolase [Acidimicrobiia bacterium]
MTTETQTEPAVQGISDERPPLLFVHGAWGGAWVWHDHFIPWFAERGWKGYAFDLRHHGDRGGPKSLRRTRIKDYVDDLAAAVADLPRPPIIVGHSMGALVTQRYLEDRTLPGAVLLAPVPLGGVWKATARTARRHPLKFLQANLMLDLGKAMDSPGPVKSMLMDHDATDAQVADMVARTGGESYLAYLDMMFVTRARPQLVQTPVAVVIADRDRLFSVKEGTKLASAYGVEPIVVTGVAHQMPSSVRWQRAAEAVERALASLG